MTAIIDRFKGTNKSISFTEDDIQNFLFYEYGKAHTFSGLVLLYPTLDFRNNFHQDHIYANSFFKKSNLKKKGISESKITFYQDNNDHIGNIQLLEGLPNEEKLNQEFDIWLDKMYPKISERNEFKKKHYIPIDIDLSFANFEQFYTKRNALISDELRKLLL